MKKKYAYKLTDQNLQTHKGFQWVLGQWKETSGEGELCGGGWLHFYSDPLLATLLNPIHADIKKPRLFKVEVSGEFKNDNGLKCGYTRARLVKELKSPKINTVQRTAFGILCALEVYKEKSFVKWAKNWLSGKDRSHDAARDAAYTAAYTAVYTAARDAARDAARAAARAADAARAAARAADAARAAYAARAAAYAADAAAYAADAAAKPLNLIKLAKLAMKVK